MKRYLVFTGENYYPSGGWDDFVGDYDDLKAAIAAADNDPDWQARAPQRWWHVVDSEGREIVADDLGAAQERIRRATASDTPQPPRP